jgi:hypothetical protein
MSTAPDCSAAACTQRLKAVRVPFELTLIESVEKDFIVACSATAISS